VIVFSISNGLYIGRFISDIKTIPSKKSWAHNISFLFNVAHSRVKAIKDSGVYENPVALRDFLEERGMLL